MCLLRKVLPFFACKASGNRLFATRMKDITTHHNNFRMRAGKKLLPALVNKNREEL